mmetsp:Transcript_47673/g.125845  ORF Transcript_47673/g.125845 Transcript_47673/m.125845 type:complete len:85 (+) Transcript_47673:61-315(+)
MPKPIRFFRRVAEWLAKPADVACGLGAAADCLGDTCWTEVLLRPCGRYLRGDASGEDDCKDRMLTGDAVEVVDADLVIAGRLVA